jgi:hypothetical protein
MVTDTPSIRPDASARAAALATRSHELRRAQEAVQNLTAHEVRVLARTASSFFDALPLMEFTPALFPPSARALRRIRHRILHRIVRNSSEGTLIRVLLLGREGTLRVFTARSVDSRDLLLILEPSITLPATVVREVVEWDLTMRIPGFWPFDILAKLSGSLDVVEEQLAYAEERVRVQHDALVQGNLAVLLPSRAGIDTDETLLSRGESVLMLSAESAVGTAPAIKRAAPAPFDIFTQVEAIAAAAAPQKARGGATSAATHPELSEYIDDPFADQMPETSDGAPLN